MSVATSRIEETQAVPAETLYQFDETPLLARQRQQESNARSYPRRIPLALKRARGIYVEDVEGRSFIDCLAGAGTLALGHNHPVVIDAIRQVLSDELPLHTLDLTTPVKDQFVQDLFGLLPPALAQEANGPESDPQNPLLRDVGWNYLKGRLRSHPDVAERYYRDVLRERSEQFIV